MDRGRRARTQLLVVDDDAAMRELPVGVADRRGLPRRRRRRRPRRHRARARRRRRPRRHRRQDARHGRARHARRDPRARRGDVDPPHVIVITAFGSIETAKRALKLGAHDYITKPFEIDDLLVAVEKALDERTPAPRGGAPAQGGRAPLPLREHHRQVGADAGRVRAHPPPRRVSSANVLITGEIGHRQGAGRARAALQLAARQEAVRRGQLRRHPRHAARARAVRLQARRLHRRAHRSARACSSRPTAAPSSSTRSATCTPALQAKLLRVLQERELRPLGAARPEKVDVRVLSATNRDLAQRMREGAFREDLFYRLNVIEVVLPPLRDRAEDVLPLAEHFLAEAATRTGKRIGALHPGGAQDPARLSVAGQRARAGERRRARGGAGRGRSDRARRSAAAGARAPLRRRARRARWRAA